MTIGDFVSENIVEIRYKPIPEILDFRGELAAALSHHMSLPHWKIDQNRVDVHDKEEAIRVFSSFANAGVVVRNGGSEDFVRVANQFLRFLLKKRPYQDKLPITRIGCKTRIGYVSPLSFEDLFSRYNSLLHISSDYKQIINAEIIDVGFPINFRTENGNLDSVCGPMRKDQLKKFFSFIDDDKLPETALYIEFDYWIAPEKEMSSNQLVPLALGYAKENWTKAEGIKDLILTTSPK